MNKKIRLGILFGGASGEHAVSVKSALYLFKNVPKDYEVWPIGISEKGVLKFSSDAWTHEFRQAIELSDLHSWLESASPGGFVLPLDSSFHQFSQFTIHQENFYLLNGKIDVIFPIIHGTSGEDGRWQSILEVLGIPYVGCDERSSMIGMDKDFQKRLALQSSVPVVPFIRCHVNDKKESIHQRILESFQYPCFIKPNSQGSSLGISEASTKETLAKALDDAFSYGEYALIEKKIIGRELECAFLGTEHDFILSGPGEIKLTGAYTYEEKYVKNNAETILEPNIPESLKESILNYSKILVSSLRLYGICRIDFWFSHENHIYFNEVNTLPGLTSISLYPKLLEHKGIYPEYWIDKVIKLAMMRNYERKITLRN